MNEQKIKALINDNIERYKNPAFVKYTTGWVMSPVDPSYVYNKIVGGVRKPKLVDRKPKISEDCGYGFLEYGFDENGKCLYRKHYFKEIELLDELYFYEDNTIYQVEIRDNTDWHDGIFFDKFQNANNLDCHITHEYHFDEKNRPLKVICHLCGLERNEEYNWKNDDVAFVREHSCNHIMIKDGKKDILCVGQLAEADADNCVISYQSEGYICTDNYTTRNSNQLQHSTLDIQYSLINDMNGKATEYYELLIDGEKYIVFFNYIKPPKDFSYKKAKEIYKNEIMNAIEKQISQLDFKVKTVGIQYGNYGYSITEPYLGFEENENNDVQSMTYAFEYAVTPDNRETIAALDDYIKAQGYYNAFRKLMVSIKKELAEKYRVKVVLDEIAD